MHVTNTSIEKRPKVFCKRGKFTSIGQPSVNDKQNILV